MLLGEYLLDHKHSIMTSSSSVPGRWEDVLIHSYCNLDQNHIDQHLYDDATGQRFLSAGLPGQQLLHLTWVYLAPTSLLLTTKLSCGPRCYSANTSLTTSTLSWPLPRRCLADGRTSWSIAIVIWIKIILISTSMMMQLGSDFFLLGSQDDLSRWRLGHPRNS